MLEDSDLRTQIFSQKPSVSKGILHSVWKQGLDKSHILILAKLGIPYMLARKLIPDTYELLIKSRPEEKDLITTELLVDLLEEFIWE